MTKQTEIIKDRQKLTENETNYKNHVEDMYKKCVSIIHDLGLPDNCFNEIFGKMITPLFYFNKSDSENDKATDKQIKYAEFLGIDKPSQYTKMELSKKIDSLKGK